MKLKWIKFTVVLLLFLAADAWIYRSLSAAFTEYTSKNTISQIQLFAMTAPKDGGDTAAWLESAASFLPASRILYLPYDEEAQNFVLGETEAAAEGLSDIWIENEASAEFKKGVESAWYGEIYKIRLQKSNAYFVPITDEEGFEVTGLLFVLFAPEASGGYLALLKTLLILAAVIFAAVYGISLFSRDIFTGYGVLILYIIAGIFIVYPLFEALRLTFITDGNATLSVWKSAFGKDSLRALWGSLKLGVLTATVSTLIGFIFAFAVERTTIKGKKFVVAMANMPIISPPFSLTLSLILLAGNNGLITRQLFNMQGFTIYGLGGLVLVQTIGMFPIAFMTLQGILHSIDSTVEDASLDLNASRRQTFFNVTLPLAMPGVMSAWLLVFTNSLADFANPLLLAGDYRVLSVEAYVAVTGRADLGQGAALSILLLLPTMTAFFIQRYWVSRKSFVTVTGKPSTRLTELTTPVMRRLLTVFIYAIIIGITSLYLTIVAGCFVKNWGIDYTFTLQNIGEALTRGKQSIVDTLTLAGIATPIAGILAMVTALLFVRKKFVGKRLLEALTMTPYAVPGTLVGISFILAFNKQPLILVGTGAIIIINYVIRELPVGVETGVASLRQIDGAIEESAYDLGADSPTVFRTIVLPLIRPAFITSMSYTFVRSMTAVSAVVFLISARWYHITMQIYNFSENLRFGLASVLATVLILIILAVFGLLRILVPDRGHTEKTIG